MDETQLAKEVERVTEYKRREGKEFADKYINAIIGKIIDCPNEIWRKTIFAYQEGKALALEEKVKRIITDMGLAPQIAMTHGSAFGIQFFRATLYLAVKWDDTL